MEQDIGRRPAERSTGTVKWFNTEKGYGFVSNDDGTGDVFIHFSNIEMPGYRTLEEGQSVEFAVTRIRQGVQAEDLRVIPPGRIAADEPVGIGLAEIGGRLRAVEVTPGGAIRLCPDTCAATH